MISPLLVRVAALALLASQLQPLAAAVLCDTHRNPAEACEEMGMGDDAANASVAPSHAAADCALMGPCAPPATSNQPVAAPPEPVFSELLVPVSGQLVTPASFDIAPSPPPPQA